MRLPGEFPITKPGSGKLKKLEEGRSSAQLLSFPADVAGLNHYVSFLISKDNKFRRDAVRRNEAQKIIVLPMPSTVATAYNAQYNAEGLGPLSGQAAAIGAGARGENGFSGQGFAQSLVDAFTLDSEQDKAALGGGLANLGALAAEAEVGALAGGLAGGLGGAALGATASGALQAGLAGAGIARNPHLATLFTGVNFREHTFQYKLVPKSRIESDRLREIIYAFKYHMAPSYGAEGHFFNYPEQFDIEFKNKDYLFDIGASVLTSFSVDYTAEGSSFFFDETNAPVSVSLSMSFQELTINTKENLDRSGGGR